jgi:hypothetical protein
VILILFTTTAPNPLTEELSRHGQQVYEALAISEVLALAEQHPTASIVITPDVDQARASIIQKHWPTVRLQGVQYDMFALTETRRTKRTVYQAEPGCIRGH